MNAREIKVSRMVKIGVQAGNGGREWGGSGSCRSSRRGVGGPRGEPEAATGVPVRQC